MGLVVANGCTEPTACPANGTTALSLSLRAPGGTIDITQGARIDVVKDGAAFPQGSVRYPGSGTALGAPIFVDGSGGDFTITVHRNSYRDTTVTATVVNYTCGPAYPPLALIVVLTAL